jgi:hypothetical protein
VVREEKDPFRIIANIELSPGRRPAFDIARQQDGKFSMSYFHEKASFVGIPFVRAVVCAPHDDFGSSLDKNIPIVFFPRNGTPAGHGLSEGSQGQSFGNPYFSDFEFLQYRFGASEMILMRMGENKDVHPANTIPAKERRDDFPPRISVQRTSAIYDHVASPRKRDYLGGALSDI